MDNKKIRYIVRLKENFVMPNTTIKHKFCGYIENIGSHNIYFRLHGSNALVLIPHEKIEWMAPSEKLWKDGYIYEEGGYKELSNKLLIPFDIYQEALKWAENTDRYIPDKIIIYDKALSDEYLFDNVILNLDATKNLCEKRWEINFLLKDKMEKVAFYVIKNYCIKHSYDMISIYGTKEELKTTVNNLKF